MEKDEIKNYIHQAIQAGKSETSGLVSDLINKMDSSIEQSVKKHVNGKIMTLTQKFDDYVLMDNTRWEEYKPYLEGLKNLSGSAKIMIWTAGGITAIISAYLYVKKIIDR